MTNTLIQQNAGIVARGLAATISANLSFCKNISKQDSSIYDGTNGFSPCATVYIPKPARYIPQNTLDITSSIQAVSEEKVPLTLDIISTVGVSLTSLELSSDINLKSVINRINDQAGVSIAHDIEKQMIKKATQYTYNQVGTAGSTNYGISTILAARTKVNKFLCPTDGDRTLLLEGDASAAAVEARAGLFNASSKIASQYENGAIGRADGFNWYENELLYNHTNGNDVTGVTVKTTSIAGATTLAVSGLTTTTGTVKKGQVFTVAGIYAVNPQTRDTYNFLQQFTVTADATADGSGDATLSISPTIYSSTSGGLQNVSGFPTAANAIVFSGAASTAYRQSLAFHKKAFRMVSVPLEMPRNAEFSAQATEQGITVQIVREMDVRTREWITRVDFLGGLAIERPEWACRITS